MISGIGNYSEIGKLRKVLIHRLGNEIEGLVPSNFTRLLFDDIPYLKAAQEEHDAFARTLIENGVEVAYVNEETAKALSDFDVRSRFIDEFIAESDVSSPAGVEALREYLLSFEPGAIVDKVISGIKKTEIRDLTMNSLSDFVNSDYPYHTDPMPNIYFTRDFGTCIGEGVAVYHMKTKARRRESLLLRYMCEYNRDFAQDGAPIWYDYHLKPHIEGGDVLVLSDRTLIVGLSERTSPEAVELLAERLLADSNFENILAFDIPKRRAFMHLDTVFTMVDYDKFTIHPEIEGPLRIFDVVLGNDGKAKFSMAEHDLTTELRRVLRNEDVELIRCGGGDDFAAQREQWSDGSNTLAIAPGVVITYDRNYVTNELLDSKGIKVLEIPSAELARGRGGPRCMSFPIVRDAVKF